MNLFKRKTTIASLPEEMSAGALEYCSPPSTKRPIYNKALYKDSDEEETEYETQRNKLTVITPMYFVPVLFTNRPMHFHLKIWVNASGIDDHFIKNKTDFDNKTKIGFYNKSDAEDFMKWWEKYKTFFNNEQEMNSYYYPQLPEGLINGYACRTHSNNDSELEEGPRFMSKEEGSILNNFRLRNDEEKDWLWIITNTEGAYHITSYGWIFKNPTDYTMFKMLQK